MIERLGPLGLGACAALLIAAAALISQAPALWRALTVPGPAPGAEAPALQARASRHAAELDAAVAQWKGRSPFFTPPAPPPPPARARTDEDRGPPPAPSSYAGPRIVAIVGETVWFDDGQRLSAGASEDPSLSVRSVRPPWSARVIWRGVEFDVPLFERTTDQFLQRPEPVAGRGEDQGDR